MFLLVSSLVLALLCIAQLNQSEAMVPLKSLRVRDLSAILGTGLLDHIPKGSLPSKVRSASGDLTCPVCMSPPRVPGMKTCNHPEERDDCQACLSARVFNIKTAKKLTTAKFCLDDYEGDAFNFTIAAGEPNEVIVGNSCTDEEECNVVGKAIQNVKTHEELRVNQAGRPKVISCLVCASPGNPSCKKPAQVHECQACGTYIVTPSGSGIKKEKVKFCVELYRGGDVDFGLNLDIEQTEVRADVHICNDSDYCNEEHADVKSDNKIKVKGDESIIAQQD